MKALDNGGDLAATDTAAITKEITRTVTIIIITALFKVCIFMFRNSTNRHFNRMALEIFAQKYVGEIQRSILSGTCENALGRSSLGTRGRKADQRQQTASRRS
jgi:hypothetical protein